VTQATSAIIGRGSINGGSGAINTNNIRSIEIHSIIYSNEIRIFTHIVKVRIDKIIAIPSN